MDSAVALFRRLCNNNIGIASRFTLIECPVKGLLCLAGVNDLRGWGDAVMGDIRSVS
jgi:hypothetical protein